MSQKPIAVNYSDSKLRILVEEYIIQQKSEFTLQDVCSYVLYWSMEDGHTTSAGIFESDKLSQVDTDRISQLLAKIVGEGRIAFEGESYKKLKNS